MGSFKYREDLEDWLEPMGYEEFWCVIQPYKIKLPDKLRCDGKVIGGKVTEERMLAGLKYITLTQMVAQLKLKRRPIQMPDSSSLTG